MTALGRHRLLILGLGAIFGYHFRKYRRETRAAVARDASARGSSGMFSEALCGIKNGVRDATRR